MNKQLHLPQAQSVQVTPSKFRSLWIFKLQKALRKRSLHIKIQDRNIQNLHSRSDSSQAKTERAISRQILR
jgi:hypothetical protein